MPYSVRARWREDAFHREVADRARCRVLLRAHARHLALVSAVDLVDRAYSTPEILGFASARSCMILDALNASRRWTMVTDFANRVRNCAFPWRCPRLPPR